VWVEEHIDEREEQQSVDKYELATIDTEAMRKAALAKQPDEFKDVKPLTEKEHDDYPKYHRSICTDW
jgi:hypothetical protein